MADSTQNLFRDNEKHANNYAAYCLRCAAVLSALMWILNILGFFIVDKVMMNIIMPVGILFFLLPTLFIRILGAERKFQKYLIMLCFILGIGCMAGILTLQMILAWACPLVLSCHCYSPRFTRYTLVAVILCMLCSFYIGLFYGVWDANMMRSSEVINGAALRAEYIREQAAAGDNIILRTFNFYYMPRVVILVVAYLISATLSKRTHGLLKRQDKVNREKERISTELSVATQIQADMLPSIFPAFPERSEFDIYATMNPAKEVGGDFYDFFMVDQRHLAIVMADVSGKGVPAALFMVIGKTLIKDHTKPDRDLGEVFTEVNKLLCESNSENLFITAFEGVLDLVTGEFRYVNAGHEIPYICKKGGVYEPHKIPAAFVLAGMEEMHYTSGTMQLEPGDKVFQYTDGVTEATNKDNELYGMKRLTGILGENSAKSPAELLFAVKEDLNHFVGEAPQFDDITMLCVEYRAAMTESEDIK